MLQKGIKSVNIKKLFYNENLNFVSEQKNW